MKSFKYPVLLAVTALLLLAGLALTLLFKAELDKRAPATIKVNQLIALDKNPAVGCPAPANLPGLKLYVAGMDTGVSAAGCDDKSGKISFLFKRSPRNDQPPSPQDEAVWTKILGNPLDTIPSERQLPYDVRLVLTGAAPVYLIDPPKEASLRIFKSWAPLVLAFVIWIWFLLGYLSATTELLRDPAPAGAQLTVRTYSLARTQMAWWFAIIFASFVFLWLVTGETPSISPQALALLGISATTTVASNGISGDSVSAGGKSGEFFADLLSDANGVAIHRFQMVAMTVTLGLLFLFDVATKLAMPSFDASLLTLMGISASTYVTMKIPEAKASPPADGAGPSAPVDDPKDAYTPTP